MPFRIRIETERGGSAPHDGVHLSEKAFHIRGLLDGAESMDRKVILLRYLDDYGDTTFNWLQRPDLINDISVLEGVALMLEEKELLRQLRYLIAKWESLCPNDYLKFYGD